MRVTLDVFSGWPNPSWELSKKESRQLVDRFAGMALPRVTAVEPVLGFRGYVVSAESDDEARKANVPDTFFVGGMLPREFVSAVEAAALPALDEDQSDDAALWLLNTAEKAIGDKLASYVEDVVKTRKVERAWKPARVRKRQELALPAGCTIRNSPYVPAFWNQPAVMPFNNCYNYAMNYRSNTFAQPGRKTGQLLDDLTCVAVISAATLDGCTVACTGIAKEAALVVWPGFDFHWYRRHTDGFWAHKIGPAQATNLDNAGRVIGGNLTPQNCDRGPYTNFCAFMFSPLGIVVL